MKKNYFIIGLFLLLFNQGYSQYYFQVSNIDALSGGQAYELNQASNPLSFNVYFCAFGDSQPQNSTQYTITWYVNSVNSTVGGTSLGSTTKNTIPQYNLPDNLKYYPSTSQVGTYYYYAVLSNPSMKSCGFQESLVSTIQKVDVVSPATHLNFDGVDDKVELGGNLTTYFAGKKAATIEAWVKPETTSGNGVIVGNYDYPYNNSQLQMLLRRDGAEYHFFIDGGTGYSEVIAPNTVVLNTWQHVVGTWDGTTMKIYVNGVLKDSASKTGTIPLTNTQFIIGNNAINEHFEGSIDEVRLWDTPRTAKQISNSRFCELQGDETGLVAYYKFNQGLDAGNNTGITTLTDATANANNGILFDFAETGSISNFLAGSPVTTGSTIPSAPTADNQTFCETTTVASLVPAPSTTTFWYADNTTTSALSSTDTVETGTYYVATANANGCESDRTAVDVVVIVDPTPETEQSFCGSGTVADLSPATSETIKWYADATTTTALETTEALADNTTYYVQAAAGTCVSNRVAVAVSLSRPAVPTNIGGLETTNEANKNLNVVLTGDCVNATILFVLDGQLNGRNKYTDGYANIAYNSDSSKWVLYLGSDILEDNFASLTTNSTDIYPSTTGWSLIGCDGTMTTETITTYLQKVCENSDANGLTPPPSETTRWFYDATGSEFIEEGNSLNPGVYYVASVNSSGCESERTAVEVRYFPKLAAPVVAGNIIPTSSFNITITGNCVDLGGYFYYHNTDEISAKNRYVNDDNSSIRVYYNLEDSKWILEDIDSNVIYYENTTSSSDAFPPTTGWTAVNECGSLAIEFFEKEQTFCKGATAGDIVATTTGSGLMFYNLNQGMIVDSADLLSTGAYLVFSINENGCEGEPTFVLINVETITSPVPEGLIANSSINFATRGECNGESSILNGTFNFDGVDVDGYNKYVFADNEDIKLYFEEADNHWFVRNVYTEDVLFFNNSISDSKVPPTTGWGANFECNLDVEVSFNDYAQSFCGNATVSDLTVTGEGTIKWYDVAADGTALDANATIASGDYYVASTNTSGCESARVKVAVIVTAPPVAVAQTFCLSGTVGDLVATGSDLKWYATADGDDLLTPSTALETRNYYVSQTVGDCTTARTEVSVTISNLPVISAQSESKTIAENEALTFTVTATDVITYQWEVSPNGTDWFAINADVENSEASGFTSNVLTISGDNLIQLSGYKFRVVLNADTCPVISDEVTATITLGTSSFENTNFSYYPNPTNGILNIDYSKDIQQVTVFSILGKLVQETKPNTSNAKVDLSSLAAGNYLVQVKANDEIKTIKIVKK